MFNIKKNKKIILFIIFLFLFTQKVDAVLPSAYQYYASANYYILKKQPKMAVEELKKAIAIDEKDAMLRTKLAGLYVDLGMDEAALTEYLKAKELRSDDAFINISIANIYEKRKDYAKALDYYSEAEKLAPNYKYNLLNLGNIYMQLGQTDEALKYYKDFSVFYPYHFEVKKVLASLYLEKEDYQNAINEYKFIYKKNPKEFRDYYKYAYALMKTGDYQNATEGFKEAIKQNSKDANAYANLGICYLNSTPSDKVLAREYIEKALNINPDLNEIRFDYAILLSQENKFNEAYNEYKSYIEKYPSNPSAYYNLGIASQKLEKYDEAIANFQKVLNFEPSNKDAKLELARSYQMNNENKKALDIYNEISKTVKDDANLYYNMGLVYVNLNNYTESIKLFEKALELKNDEETRKELASVYVNAGNNDINNSKFDEAIKKYQKAIEYNSNLAMACTGLAYCYEKKSDTQKSLEFHEKAIALENKNTDSFVAYGNTLLHLNKYEEAKGAYQKAFELNSKNDAAKEGLGDIYYKQELFSKAIKEYKDALVLNPQNVNVNIKLGNLYKDDLDNEKALFYYNEALKISPENTTALHNKAATLYSLEKYQEAKDCYKTLLSYNKDFDMAYYGMGVIYEKEKNYSEAVKNYEKFVSLTADGTLKNTIKRRIELLKSRK